MVPSLNGLCSFEIRINEEEEERMKRLPRWVRNSHQSAVEELERMRHDPAVGDKLVARAILDGRILDLPLSKPFYKAMLDQELDMYDIESFDPGLGR